MLADQIELIVETLLKLKNNGISRSDIDLIPEFEDFRQQNKLFYDIILSPSELDLSIFKEMMKMKRKLESGDDQYSVDVRFGQFMSDKYLSPVVSKLN
jgi:hypothetical protein